MIIKSHIRGGYRSAAAYLKDQGKNEKTRLMEISDPHAKNLDEAFRAMWAVANGTKVKKTAAPCQPQPDEGGTLNRRASPSHLQTPRRKLWLRHGEHQRMIVEHIKEGRQHFHVIWNRVNLTTGKAHWPYMHKKQSKMAAREMEKELGLKTPTPRKARKPRKGSFGQSQKPKTGSMFKASTRSKTETTFPPRLGVSPVIVFSKPSSIPKSAAPMPRPTTPRKTYDNGPKRRRRNIWVPCERREN